MPTLFNFFKKYLSPPVFQDPETTASAQLLHPILLAVVALTCLIMPLTLVVAQEPLAIARDMVGSILLLMASLVALWLERRGAVRLASGLFLAGGWLVITVGIVAGAGLIGPGFIGGYLTLIVLVGILLGGHATVIVAASSTMIGLLLLIAESMLVWKPAAPSTSQATWAGSILLFWLVVVVQQSWIRVRREALARAQAELLERQQADARLRALVESSPDYILEINRAGQIIFINRLAENFLGKNIRDVLPADQVERSLEVMERAFTSGEPQTTELLTITPEGREVWDSIRVGLVKSGNQTTSLTIIMTDITAQKKAESAIRESEKRYRNSIITAGLVPYEIDYHQKRFTFIADDIVKLTGYTPAEYTPKILKESVQEDYVWGPNAKLTPDEARQLFLSGAIREWRSDMRILTRTGESRWLSDTSVEIPDETGKTQGAVGIFQDITERKRIETERENLITELEKRNAELERFNYTLSHELKTPLVTIRGFLGFLEESVAKNNGMRIKSDMDRIAKATDKMHIMINELLELSRIGRMLNPPEDVPFAELVRDVFLTMEDRIASNNIKIEVDSNLPMVHGDRPRLVEVIQNLVDNAIKNMGSQSEPIIHIGVRHADLLPIFFVKDNGTGIASNYHEKIFGLFDKLDPLSEGSGIGLALVKRIIETHGGKIWVESDGLGKGSTFCFILPERQGS